MQFYYVKADPKVVDRHIYMKFSKYNKLPTCNTFRDKRHLLILVAITPLSKELQFCNLTM